MTIRVGQDLHAVRERTSGSQVADKIAPPNARCEHRSGLQDDRQGEKRTKQAKLY